MPFGTVGAKGGFQIALASASYDSGPYLSVFPVPANNAGSGLPTTWGQLPTNVRSVVFQLIPGDMTVGSVTVYGTTDAATAGGNGDAWEPIVAPSSEAAYQWTNPLSAQAGQRTLKCDVPYIAYRALTSADFNGTTTRLSTTAGP